MKTLLAVAALSLTAALSGCSLANIASKVPPNSFGTIHYNLTIGPFVKDTKLTDGEKQADGTVKLRDAVASTKFMGYGGDVEVTNLVVLPASK